MKTAGTKTAGLGLAALVFSVCLAAFGQQPRITGTSLSGSNLVISGINGQSGGTYYVLTSTNAALALSRWTPVMTNVLGASGAFSITVTNTVIRGTRQEFYILQLRNATSTPPGMALIPAGAFTMGDTLDGESDAVPTVTVNVSSFYMDTNLVGYSQWQSVYDWGVSAGYDFDNAGSGKATNQPVYNVDWYDAVKWSNARSEQAGLIAVYYTDAAFTQVYANGDTDEVYANWAANGYRLPTEAEWEKAARGGLSGQRFPWGDTISETQANYLGDTTDYSYDLGPNGNNIAFMANGLPYTSPVGYFAPNHYGLYDMAGNVWEWCWDWYATPYAGGADPRGPASGSLRVLRGGYWHNDASNARCAYRNNDYPSYAYNYGFGFRCVRGL